MVSKKVHTSSPSRSSTVAPPSLSASPILFRPEIPHLAQADDDGTYAKCTLYHIVIWDSTGYARNANIMYFEYDVPCVLRVPSDSRWYCRLVDSDRIAGLDDPKRETATCPSVKGKNVRVHDSLRVVASRPSSRSRSLSPWGLPNWEARGNMTPWFRKLSLRISLCLACLCVFQVFFSLQRFLTVHIICISHSWTCWIQCLVSIGFWLFRELYITVHTLQVYEPLTCEMSEITRRIK